MLLKPQFFKKINFKNNFICKIYNNNTNLNIFLYFNDNKKLYFKIVINCHYLFIKNQLIFFNKINNFIFFFNKIIKNQINNLFFFQYNYYLKLNVIGLGYKNFILKDDLYILIGDSNYIIIPIPKDIKIFCKKKQIYLFGLNKSNLNYFASNLKLLKKINYYKGKGILQFKNFKFMKLKTGKKQRFM